MLSQQIELELVKVSQVNKKIEIAREKPEFIFLCANHKPAKTTLKTELKLITETAYYKKLKETCNIKMATSAYMGYGLYSEYMKPLEEFLSKNI